MRKLWVCLLYALCVFAIVFSLFWMALPKLSFPSPKASSAAEGNSPSAPAQAGADTAQTSFWLCDEGGRVTVYRCSADGLPDELLLRTGIYVNLLPENDALRIKQGLRVPGESTLRQLLEDLGE